MQKLVDLVKKVTRNGQPNSNHQEIIQKAMTMGAKGGKRDGAGRPPIPPAFRKDPVLVKLSAWILEILQSKIDTSGAGSRTELIEEALIAHFHFRAPPENVYWIDTEDGKRVVVVASGKQIEFVIGFQTEKPIASYPMAEFLDKNLERFVIGDTGLVLGAKAVDGVRRLAECFSRR